MVLHHREPRAAGGVGAVQVLGELVGEHRAGADVERLAGLHDVVQRLDGLLDRRLIVEAVDLVEVDVVEAQPGQAGVDRLAGCACARGRRGWARAPSG